MIEIQDVTKTYSSGIGAVRALDGVSLRVEPGEVVLLMGPSGSGKTTLLSIMGCILRPTSGRVVVAGTDIATLDEAGLSRLRLEQIGFVFQGFNLFPTLTAGENVEMALNVRGIDGAASKQTAEESLEAVGLAAKYREFPANLSGGQKQRVAIARALAGGPRLIMADEPTAALDSASGRTVMELLSTLAHQRGRAVVIVTHDNRVTSYADRILHIEDGRLA